MKFVGSGEEFFVFVGGMEVIVFDDECELVGKGVE